MCEAQPFRELLLKFLIARRRALQLSFDCRFLLQGELLESRYV